MIAAGAWATSVGRLDPQLAVAERNALAWFQPLAPDLFVIDLTQNAVANLGWDEVRLPHPVFDGDTIYARSEVLETRESKSRPNAGIVRVKTTGVNQHGTPVIEFKRTFMVWKRGHVPVRR